MATQRRTTTQEKAQPSPDVSTPGRSNISPAVPKEVIFKLLFFTFAMIVCPIGSYFVTKDLVFGGNTTYAGGTAAIVANVVLIGYVVVAFQEDQADRAAEEDQARKAR